MKSIRKREISIEDEAVEQTTTTMTTTCGLGSWRPQWLQPMANAKLFLLNLCLIGIVQSMAGALQFSIMNSLEKRFAFDSKISAVINIADNFSVMFLSPLIGYYGIRFNRSKLIGIGQMIIAASCFISATPYFIYGPAKHFYENTQTNTKNSFLNSSVFFFNSSSSSSPSSSLTCHLKESVDSSGSISQTLEQCTTGSTIWPAVYIFFLGQFVRGVGNAVYYVIALPFVDDNVPKKSSPVYISIMQTVLVVGPACNLILCSFLLKLNEDPWTDTGLAAGNDPRFIGAYWLCYLANGALVLLVSLPVFLFPAQFSGASVPSANLSRKMADSGGFREALRRFTRNPLIVLFLLGNATRYSGIIGFYMFYVKYLETAFRISVADTTRYLGSASLVPMAVGILAGGLAIAYFKPKARALFVFLFLAELTSVLTIGSGLFLACPPVKLQGEIEEQGSDGLLSLNSSCNAGCHCSTAVFSPLCDLDSQKTYFSPCHAGCSAFNAENSAYSDCSCVEGSGSTRLLANVTPTPTIVQGYCPEDVSQCLPPLIKFILIMVVGNTVSQMSTTGNFLINYRAVEPMDKSFVSGLIGTFISIISFIPVPLLYGHIADSSCLVWEEKCGKRGNCWFYDNDRFRAVFMGTTVAFLAAGSFFDFLMIFFADRLKNLYDDEDSNSDKETENETPGESNQMEVLQK